MRIASSISSAWNTMATGPNSSSSISGFSVVMPLMMPAFMNAPPSPTASPPNSTVASVPRTFSIWSSTVSRCSKLERGPISVPSSNGSPQRTAFMPARNRSMKSS